MVGRPPTYDMAARDERYRNRTEILQGTLDMLILQTLQWAPRHGYALSKQSAQIPAKF